MGWSLPRQVGGGMRGKHQADGNAHVAAIATTPIFLVANVALAYAQRVLHQRD